MTLPIRIGAVATTRRLERLGQDGDLDSSLLQRRAHLMGGAIKGHQWPSACNSVDSSLLQRRAHRRRLEDGSLGGRTRAPCLVRDGRFARCGRRSGARELTLQRTHCAVRARLPQTAGRPFSHQLVQRARSLACRQSSLTKLREMSRFSLQTFTRGHLARVVKGGLQSPPLNARDLNRFGACPFARIQSRQTLA